ncbi:MAG: hypothetical protein AAGG48_01485 [Planctomycetota bacterium]
MVNTRYNIPRSLKLQCKEGSVFLQQFYQSHFVNDIAAMRDGTNLACLESMSREELQIAKALAELNRNHLHVNEARKLILDRLRET